MVKNAKMKDWANWYIIKKGSIIKKVSIIKKGTLFEKYQPHFEHR